MPAPDLSARAEASYLIVFADLTRYAAQSLFVGDAELATTIDAYYERLAVRVEQAGGTVIKFVGDAALMVFPPDEVDRAVEALLELKREIDDWFASLRWECRLMIKAHFGAVIAGPYGGAGAKRFDVIGKEVNTAAMLDSMGVTLSAEAFRKLSPEMRERFKKHTWPVTYIRAEDPHLFRRR